MTGRHRRPHLLMVCYYFPPWGMGGVQRPLKFARYLPQYGWDVTVVAPRPGNYFHTDISLLNELSDSVRVVRVPAWTPSAALARIKGRSRPIPSSISSSAMARWWREWTRFPDDKILFARSALQESLRLMANHPFDLVWTSSPPPSIHLVGHRLSKRVGWIADFRDPWLLRTDDWGPTPIHETYNKHLHRTYACTADQLIAVNDAIADMLNRTGSKRPAEVLHNGYDESDFHQHSSIRDTQEPLTIVCPGTFGQNSDPTVLFRTIQSWAHANPKMPFRVIHLGASVDYDSVAAARHYGLGDSYEDRGYRPHAELIAALCKADVIAISITSDSEYRDNVPGRIYEALRSLHPVALFGPPSSEAARLLRPIPGCHVCTSNNPKKMLDTLHRAVSHERGQSVRTLSDIKMFDRSHQARRLAEICEAVYDERTAGAKA